uniref:beta-N-acetylhexosaminidase n=1 Tax=uncultured Cytophagia bacterium TaxID=768505 RepID=H6RE96_9BACT|nr:glycoside hydrolase, family 3 [uncultured Cytophagia bacterium]
MIVGAFVFLSSFLFEQTKSIPAASKEIAPKITPIFLKQNSKWVDSVFSTLSEEERIAQLFMVAAYSNRDSSHQFEIEKLITDQKIGGLIFFQGGPIRQANLTNAYQAKAKVPLLVSIDAEWGLAMRLDSTMKFPKQMTLGAIFDNNLIYQMGEQIAMQCKRMGVHVNLAPVADVNNNSKNPVINYRSFGEDKYKVANKAIAYMKGMQNKGIMANAKHFPGHGDTDSDSHKTLPIIKHTRERLDSLELYPFQQMIDSGLGSMMIAHLYIPSLDERPNRASTLSENIVTDLLQKEMGFEGLIFTDALNMRGVSAFYDPGKLDVEALLAGNDVLLFSEDVPKAIEEIKIAIDQKLISQKEIDRRCRKILSAKAWCGLNEYQSIDTPSLLEDLHKTEAQFVNMKLYESALTLLKNEEAVIPVMKLAEKKIASITIGAANENEFNTSIDRYCDFDAFSYSLKPSNDEIKKALDELKEYNLVLITIHDMNQRPYQNFGITKQLNSLVDSLASNHNVIVNILGNPYCLNNFDGGHKAKAILVSYEEEALAQDISGQMIFGGLPIKGKLPVSIKNHNSGVGIIIENSIRLNYTMPQALNISPKDLSGVDLIVSEALREKVFPGCQIFAAKDGKVFYYKSFGNHTYDKDALPVKTTDIYDLASITKIASSTASLMKLQSEGVVNVDSSLGVYLPDMVDTSAYKNILLKEMLTHQAGFTPWIPFYIRTLHKGKPKFELYSVKQTDYFSERVADNLFAHKSLRDSIFKKILSTKVSPVKKYKYSDIGYYFINEIIRNKTNMTQDDYVMNTFYNPLGLGNIGYNPRQKWNLNRIPPTEDDKTFRGQLIQGDVHDQGAAMLGGVCGHAGLFANANDLGVMMQLFMQYGEYGGERYFKEEVVKYFTSAPYYVSNKNRRGIGFDKAVRAGGSGPTCSKCASNESFGHSGFTGTITWADPKTGFVYVFLSNRVNPNAENRKIISLGIRTRIQKIFTDALAKAEKAI